jgi:hypothetical protein
VAHLRATLRSLGALGVLLMLALLAALVWLLVTWNWIRVTAMPHPRPCPRHTEAVAIAVNKP